MSGVRVPHRPFEPSVAIACQGSARLSHFMTHGERIHRHGCGLDGVHLVRIAHRFAPFVTRSCNRKCNGAVAASLVPLLRVGRARRSASCPMGRGAAWLAARQRALPGSPATAARRSDPSRAAEGGASAAWAGSRPGDRGGVQPVRRRPGPARRARLEGAALAYLAKHRTESARAELVPILGPSRPESVLDLSSPFAAPPISDEPWPNCTTAGLR